MRSFIRPFAVVAALALGSAGAFAQQSATGGTSQGSQSSTGTAKSTQDVQFHAMSQERLKKALREAGFQEINVVGATYVVHAKSEDGDSVVMYVTPPPVQGASAPGSSATGAGSGTSGSGPSAGTDSPAVGDSMPGSGVTGPTTGSGSGSNKQRQ
jgi:hypothetical protein